MNVSALMGNSIHFGWHKHKTKTLPTIAVLSVLGSGSACAAPPISLLEQLKDVITADNALNLDRYDSLFRAEQELRYGVPYPHKLCKDKLDNNGICNDLVDLPIRIKTLGLAVKESLQGKPCTPPKDLPQVINLMPYRVWTREICDAANLALDRERVDAALDKDFKQDIWTLRGKIAGGSGGFLRQTDGSEARQ